MRHKGGRLITEIPIFFDINERARGKLVVDKTKLILLRTALGPTIGGTVYLVARYLPPTPYWDAVFRALPAGLLLLVLRFAIPRGIWWWRAFVVGTLNIGVFFGLLFVSAQRLPAGVAATLGATSTLVAIGFAALMLRERVRAIQYLAAVTGIAGVALLVLRGTTGVDTIGVIAGLGSAVSLGVGMVFSRKWGRPEGVHSLAFAGWTLVAGSAILLPVAVLAEGGPPSPTLGQLAGLAWVSLVGAGLAYALLLIGVQQLPVGLTAPLPLINPLTAALLGWAVANETLSLAQILGGVLVFVSVLVGSRPRRAATASVGVQALEPDLGRT
jgi:probable blue pigment (indigoidine) exporter